MSLRSNIFKNGFATLLLKLVRVLEQLLLIPFFLSSWGAAYYGEWLTLTIIPSIIAFSDLGFGTAAANSFVLKYVSGDYQGAANSSKTGLSLITIMVLAGMLISVLAMIVLNYLGVFEKSLIEGHDAIIAVSLLILARLSGFYSQLFESYYRAVRKAALSINLITIRAVLNLLAGFIVLFSGYGVIAFAFSQLIVIVVFNISFGMFGRRLLGNLFIQYSGVFDQKDRNDIMSKGVGFLLAPVWQAVYLQGTTLVVRLVLGPGAVTIFNTLRTFTRSINQVFSMLNKTILPELQFEIGVGNYERGKRLFGASVVTTMVFAILGVSILSIFGKWLFKVWTLNELQFEDSLLTLFLIGIIFNAIWSTASVIFPAMNRPYFLSLSGLIYALLSVILCYGLAFHFELVGVGIGVLIFEVLMATTILPKGSKMLHSNFVEVLGIGLNELRGATKRLYLKIADK